MAGKVKPVKKILTNAFTCPVVQMVPALTNLVVSIACALLAGKVKPVKKISMSALTVPVGRMLLYFGTAPKYTTSPI